MDQSICASLFPTPTNTTTTTTTIGIKWAVESIPANVPMVLYLESTVLYENDSEVRCVVRYYHTTTTTTALVYRVV